MDKVSFGKKLKSYRAKKGWSLKICAEKIGITGRYLSDIERGEKVPKFETFVDILNVLGASADDVLQDSLLIGYVAKSNDLLKLLEALDDKRKIQTLYILESIIERLE